MKMVNSYIKSLKLANNLTLTIPSKPTLQFPSRKRSSTDERETIQPNLPANQLSGFYNRKHISRTEKSGRNGLR